MKSPYKSLEKTLGYRFKSKDRLTTALTHPSYRNEKGHETCADNQRLEFLGDAVVGLLAAEHLYAHANDMNEGDMTKFRSTVTNRSGLARVGAAWGIGELLRMGRGEARSGGASKESNLADAVEAVLGAVYEDGGHKAAAKVFSRHFVPRLEHRLVQSPDVDNPKGTLQEFTQRERQTNPEYTILEETGPAHDRTYLASVTWDGEELARGEGASKRAAEVDAARKALAVLQTS
ncbi:MAG: ribonuclease III [Verrucomicrobia bacterium]|nr:ribonuclease III [Verrucomicrobiota bacterium]MCH8528594.1 ribonuclease III [Kiritimatiellia bacterium]